MRRSGTLLAGITAATVPAAAALYWFAIRPWHLRWGATAADLARRWPGDELVPNVRSRAVRAVHIDAPPERVWPWIMQVGRDRGGFYSYTWLENLIGADIHNVYELMPGLPDRQRGDTVWMAPEEKFGGEGRMVVGAVVPGRAMVLVSPADAAQVLAGGSAAQGVWSFVLEPVGDGTTRLVMLSVGGEPPRFGRLSEVAFWEPAHFVMERRMMRTLKRLAESTRERRRAPPDPD